MSTENGSFQFQMKPGDRTGGYEVVNVVSLETLEATLCELVHAKTGARHIHLASKDSENTFAVAFKTVPADSTGVAHILEHTALCGSRKFPVRDPFFSMLKRSLSTFMNAFTASDWTMYPFSTQNPKDFYNLMDVYLDAAFFPKIDELSFKQEGHRLETADGADKSGKPELAFKGIVYNEMKGAMSSPNQVMGQSLLSSLFPDTTYRFNSGGDPVYIPELTHRQLIEFHRRHYHPSNAYFYTYGNLPLEDHLTFIEDKILKSFKKTDPGTDVPSQPRWNKSREASYPFMLGKSEDPVKKYQACISWLCADIRDTFEVLVLALLEQILTGNSASPLRKALIDAGLGSALSDYSGFDADNRDTVFSIGLKDVREEDSAKIEEIVFDVLTDLAENGIEKPLIDAAIHQLEFHRKEVRSTPYPQGLRLFMSICATWLHGGRPERILKLDADLDKIKSEVESGSIFEKYIRKHFLDNPHRVKLVLKPDQEMESREQAREALALEKIRAKLAAEDFSRIAADAKALAKRQESKEDVACLPTLELADIPAAVPRVEPTAVFDSVPAVSFCQPTAGIFYFASAIDAGGLSEELAPLAPFFSYALPKIGTGKSNYVEMVRRMDLATGGLGLAAHARTTFTQHGECLPFVSFNAKCLNRNQAGMFDILSEIITEYSFADYERLKSLLFEYRAGLEAMVLQNGHRLAISLASRNFSPTGILSEKWSGIHQLRTIKEITEDINAKALAALAETLTSIGRELFTDGNMKMALIGDEKALDTACSRAAEINAGLGPKGDSRRLPRPSNGDADLTREGWYTASAVSYVASVFPAVRMVHDDAPVLSVTAKLLRSLYLHREIREKGGAYGGFALYNSEEGLFGFGSYRDPHIQATLNVYKNAADFIKSGNYSQEDIKEAILQICSEIDKPDPPGAAARKAFYRSLVGLSDAARLAYKTNLLAVTRKDVISVAEKYFGNSDEKSAVAVISGEEKLLEANKKMGAEMLELFKI
jgi:Zn-dependent M16 (insulinase) family peptidase